MIGPCASGGALVSGLDLAARHVRRLCGPLPAQGVHEVLHDGPLHVDNHWIRSRTTRLIIR
eukprot:8519289-Prorocentrum_lima.AAC.1